MYKAVFGLPWSCEQFVQRAVQAGHPAKANHAVPRDLQLALDKHMEGNEQTLVNYRMHWCRKWLARAKELEDAEKADAAQRPARQGCYYWKTLDSDSGNLDSVGYEDKDVLSLLNHAYGRSNQADA